jgi:DNA repair exonuclease SbcCD ATPase subunit
MWMEIDYLVSPTTLIVSADNGAGKSTLSIWALYYALFGKAYKKEVKVASIVNSQSNKDCLVEVEFTAQGSDWVVRRGRKPEVFDIMRDGKRVEDEAALKDYQVYLESVISMDEKAFEYIVALGPDKFVPFTSLGASQRRAFVEQILDITVISTMNELTKTRIKAIRKAAEQVYYDINMNESKMLGHERTLGILRNQRDQRLRDTSSELVTLQSDELHMTSMIDKLNAKLDETTALIDQSADKKLSDHQSMINRFQMKMIDLKNNAKKYTSMTSCPTCLQCVAEEHKQGIADTANAAVAKLEAPLQKLIDDLRPLQEKVASNAAINDKASKIRQAIMELRVKKQGVSSQIAAIKAKLANANEDAQIDIETHAILTLQDILKDLNENHQSYKQEEDETNFFLLTLKDDAVKAEIVRQYLPFLNQKINEYLDAMNLYIQMSLDEEFNISMFAPNRKGQTIDNLSTGQLRRVDLAVLLAWREVARSKASVSSNLLILDEILENLSEQGVADFAELWQTKYADKEINLFVISQRNAEFEEHFERTIKYALKDDRTVEV